MEVLTATDVTNLPPGQKSLLVTKIADILASSDESLQYPAASLLEMMLTRGIQLSKDAYRDIASPALSWGFERTYTDGRIGRSKLREALEEAAFIARGEVTCLDCFNQS